MLTIRKASTPSVFLSQSIALSTMQLRLLLRHAALWVAISLSLLATLAAYTPVSWIQRSTNQIPANSTYYFAQFLAPLIGLTCTICAFFVAGAALEDRRRRVETFVFSRPVSSFCYTASRIGILILAVSGILALDVLLAILVQPWFSQPYHYFPQVFVIWPYIEIYLVMALPAAIFFVPCAWLLAITTERLLGAVVPLFLWWALIFGTPFGLAANLFAASTTTLGQWFDPTGLAYAREVWGQALTLHPNANYLIHYGPMPLSVNFLASRLEFVVLGSIGLLMCAWVTHQQRSATWKFGKNANPA